MYDNQIYENRMKSVEENKETNLRIINETHKINMRIIDIEFKAGFVLIIQFGLNIIFILILIFILTSGE